MPMQRGGAVGGGGGGSRSSLRGPGHGSTASLRKSSTNLAKQRGSAQDIRKEMQRNQQKWMGERTDEHTGRGSTADSSRSSRSGGGGGGRGQRGASARGDAGGGGGGQKVLPGQFVPPTKEEREPPVHVQEHVRVPRDAYAADTGGGRAERGRRRRDRYEDEEEEEDEGAGYQFGGAESYDHEPQRGVGEGELDGLEDLASKIADRLKTELTEEIRVAKKEQQRKAVTEKYVSDLRMYGERCAIIEQQLESASEDMRAVEGDLGSCGKVLGHLEREEGALVKELNRIQRELDIVASQRGQQERKQAALRSEAEALNKKTRLLSSTLDNLTMHKQKCRMFVEQYAPRDAVLREYR